MNNNNKLENRQNLGIPFFDLSQKKISKKATELISKDICEKYNVIPIKKIKNILVIAIPHTMLLPMLMPVIDKIKEQNNCEVELVLASMDKIKTMIKRYYSEK